MDHVAVDVPEDDETTTTCAGVLCKSLLKADGNTSKIETSKTEMDDDAKVRRKCERPIIYRVPDILRKLDSNAYEPQVISLGPYHHGKRHLRSMDEIKREHLETFLSRNPGVGRDRYVDQVKKLEIRMRNAYSGTLPCKAKNFMDMMLLDACFVLEFLFYGVSTPRNKRLEITFVCMDMLRLENQIPLFLLKELLWLNCPQKIESLTHTIYDVFQDLMPGKIRIPLTDPNQYHHILHLLVSCAAPESAKAKQPDAEGTDESSEHWEPMLDWIPCARSLYESGVSFRNKEKSEYGSFADITFDEGTMTIPRLKIFRGIAPVFRNLIAFEQCFSAENGWKEDLHVTAYACLMDFMIKTRTDMELLDGIIVSPSGNDEEIARLFNSLCVHVPFDSNSYLSSVYKSINDYSKQRSHKWMASLRHPWAKMSAAAAFLLFILTVTQTILAFLTYLRPI